MAASMGGVKTLGKVAMEHSPTLAHLPPTLPSISQNGLPLTGRKLADQAKPDLSVLIVLEQVGIGTSNLHLAA